MGAFGIDIAREHLCIFEDGLSKHEALDRLVAAVASGTAITDREVLRRAVYEREAVQSTGISGGVGIPHVRINEVSAPTIGVGVSASGIDFQALDGAPVHVVVLFAMPSRSQKQYLNLLAHVMRALKTPWFRQRLTACRTADALWRVLNGPDAEAAGS
jgi:mannitol/fructose-specific phosphotransferase system IIA component (Ntr-type)